jgi:hypothetical protein
MQHKAEPSGMFHHTFRLLLAFFAAAGIAVGDEPADPAGVGAVPSAPKPPGNPYKGVFFENDLVATSASR